MKINTTTSTISIACRCTSHYIGESGHQYAKRIHEHLETDKKSHVYKHVTASGQIIGAENFNIIGQNYEYDKNAK